MKITVLFFAHLKEKAGAPQLVLDVPEGITTVGFKSLLEERYPALKAAMPTALISVNQEFSFDEDRIPAEAEVAVFPPVSGGEPPTILRVTREPLDLDELVEQITYDTTGAACIFTGMVRGQTQRGQAHQTISLEYEAYIPMAEAKMGQVANEIRERWPAVEGICIVQRIGHLEPRTPTVIIACTAAHRDTGVFEAARYGIDRLKEIVPIWKKEIGPEGEEWVEGEYHPRRGD